MQALLAVLVILPAGRALSWVAPNLPEGVAAGQVQPARPPTTRQAWLAQAGDQYKKKQFIESATSYREAIKLGDRNETNRYNPACDLALSNALAGAFGCLRD